MTREEFILKIAPLIVKHAPRYNILCPSAIIAQAVLESNGGNSELAVKAHNYFGLKYRQNRCPSACGIYYKVGSEQNADGSYTSSAMQWMKFSNMENGVVGYLDFINISNYQNLKGVTDPQTYLENIKKDGYATSINYVSNLMNVVNKYNLTQYDPKTSTNSTATKPMRINVHAGHNPDGKPACGAVGLIKESTENRNVKNKVVTMLRSLGHTVYDCTVDNGSNAKDIINKIVTKCNSNDVDLDVSIHFNAGSNGLDNNVTTGTEVLIYSSTSKSKPFAQNIVNEIAKLGFKNRGVKESKTLGFLKNTKAPALLIEVCFVDDPDDVELYDADKVARAIVKGITGKSINLSDSTSDSITATVTASKLRIRSNPDIESSIVGYYERGDVIKILNYSNGWCQTSKGWCSIDYLETRYGIVNCNKLNIRENHGVKYNSIGMITKNTKVRILHKAYGWYLTDLGGWVSAEYVDLI